MALTGGLSIRSKLIILLLLTSIICILVVAYQGYHSANNALRQAVVNQLATLREAKAEQVKMALSNSHDQFLAFAENRTIIDALSEFRTAFQLVSRESVSEDSKRQLAHYYQKEFVPRLKQHLGGVPQVKHYIPESNAANYLQYHYMVNNPNEVGKKDEMIQAKDDKTYYSQVHARYHEHLSSLLKTFDFYDMFLIDHETGDILYSVYKETDFGTNLKDGPYASSNLASLIKRVMRTKERGDVEFQDFDLYHPSYGLPASFAAITVFEGKDIVGILALQLSSDRLNDIMTSHQQWKNGGMGDTGEVYLVGRDLLMRSDSRFLIQHRERYLERLRNIGMPEDEIQRIDKNNTSILFQLVHSEAVNRALQGESGVLEDSDYRGVEVLSAYEPLRAFGMDWVILSEMDISELNIPIDKFRRQVIVSASILGIIVTFLALLAASYFTKPINALLSAFHRVEQGEIDVKVNVTNNDEFGDLSNSFNSMVSGIDKQKALIDQKDQENELLLRNTLPEPIVKRIRAGEQHIVDRIPNVSIVFTLLTGLSEQDDIEPPEDAIKKLNKLISTFDQTGEKLDITKVDTIAGNYMAVCGLITPRLDHYQRALSFANDMLTIVDQINLQNNIKLNLKIGIHSGPINAGVVGLNQFDYDVWGNSVEIADNLRYTAPQGSICISGQTHDLLHDNSQFIKGKSITVNGKAIQTWHLTPENNQGENHHA